jgi:AraC family transcriptional regulator
MLSTSCKHLLRLVFEKMNIKVNTLKLGLASISYNDKETSLQDIAEAIEEYDFIITKSASDILVDNIKRAVIDLIYHMNNMNSIVQKSDYLVEILNLSYDKISREFKKHEGVTLEKFTIKVKIERIKDLLEKKSHSLSEIAFMMDYSSVQHLSSQFKKYTSITVSEYLDSKTIKRIPLDQL